jgi:hypothetical protein
MKAAWRTMLDGSVHEALLAVDLYNQPRQPRRLEGFFVHMHIAWLYLLHAEFRRDRRDYRYRQPNGRFERIDGEPKTWDLQRSVEERWPQGGAVRKNLEFTIALRNKIEHRYHEAVAIATAGYAQALLLNFEEELTSAFGSELSLGEQLRFPVFVGEITALGDARIQALRDGLPRTTRDFIARFEADLDSTLINDQRYEFRVNIVPKLSSKTAADRALTFVRENELTPDEKKALQTLGKSGTVVVREQVRPVSGAGMMKPAVATIEIEKRIDFKFNMHHFVRAWKKLSCRPRAGVAHPEKTDERYCIYDEPHRDYLYTPAFIDKVVREVSDAKKFETFLGSMPVKRPKEDVTSG